MPSGIYIHKKHTEETKTKISLSKLKFKKKHGYINSPETRIKMRKNHANISGENNPMYNKQHSDQTKEKIRLKAFGRKASLKTKQLMSQQRKGKYFGPLGRKGNNATNDDTYRYRARAIIEKHLNRKLKKGECVHHLDHNVKNNDINNLHIFPSQSNHASYHLRLRNYVYHLIKGHYNEYL